MHETDRPNPDQGSPEWAVTVDARDLNDLLAVVVAQDPSLRAGSIWQRLNEACSTAGEAEPVHVPAVRCLVTQKGGIAIDLWLPVGIATDVPIPFYGPCTITLMPIDGTGVGGHGTPDHPAHGIPSPNPDDDLEAAIGHVLVSEKVSSDPAHFADLLGKLVDALRPFRRSEAPVMAPESIGDYLGRVGLGSLRSGSGEVHRIVSSAPVVGMGGSGGPAGEVVVRDTAVEVAVTSDEIALHVMVPGPPYALTQIEAVRLATDLERAAAMLDVR